METWRYTAIPPYVLAKHSGNIMDDDEFERIWKELVVL
jgi:hypothetical protein